MITDFFDRGWRAGAEATAFVTSTRTHTYAEIGELSCSVAHGLLAMDLPAPAKAAVLSGNDPVGWACVMGVWRAGLAWVPLNPANGISDVSRLLNGFDCDVLFFHEQFAPMVEALQSELATVTRFVRFGTTGEQEPAGTDAMTLASFTAGMPVTRPAVYPDPDMVAGIMPTGGTTGAPKGVMNTHRGLGVSVAHQMLGAFYPSDVRPVNLLAAPMTHTAGLTMMPCFARGGTVVVMSRPDPLGLLDAIETHRVTELFLPPTVIYRLLDLPGIEDWDYSSLRYLMYGAAPMSIEKLRRAIAVFGPVLYQGYGQTEAPSGIAFLRPEEHFIDGEVAGDFRLSACGRPAPLIAVEILDDEGNILPPGAPGEICVRGDLVMKGYYKNPEATAAAITGGWLHTGDIGLLDDQGFLHITDRKNDVIISGGFNVYPGEVEQVIWSHPAVSECAVVGLPHEDWGEAVTAFVELSPGAEVTEEALIAYCRERLGGVRTPKQVVFIDELPRSPFGKVLKRDLRRTTRNPTP